MLGRDKEILGGCLDPVFLLYGFVPFTGPPGVVAPGCAGRAAIPGGAALISIFLPAHPDGVPAESAVDGGLSPHEHSTNGKIVKNNTAVTLGALDFIDGISSNPYTKCRTVTGMIDPVSYGPPGRSLFVSQLLQERPGL